jgi:hypothetical protein
MQQVSRFFSGIDFPQTLPGDVSLVFAFIGLSLAFGFFFGRFKLVSILINVYIALAFIGVMPLSIFAFSTDYGKVIVFVLLLAFLTAIDERLFDLHISSAGSDFFWRLFVMSILVAGTILSTILSFLPKSIALSYVSSVAYGYFASPFALLFWLTVPLGMLLFINNRLR